MLGCLENLSIDAHTGSLLLVSEIWSSFIAIFNLSTKVLKKSLKIFTSLESSVTISAFLHFVFKLQHFDVFSNITTLLKPFTQMESN